jgi:hypothetical protein
VDFNDSAAYYTTNLTTNSIAVTLAGLYLIQWEITYEPSNSGERTASLTVNGSTSRQAGSVTATFLRQPGVTVLRLAAGDVITLSAYVDGGAAVNVRGTADRDTGLTVARIGM